MEPTCAFVQGLPFYLFPLLLLTTRCFYVMRLGRLDFSVVAIHWKHVKWSVWGGFLFSFCLSLWSFSKIGLHVILNSHFAHPSIYWGKNSPKTMLCKANEKLLPQKTCQWDLVKCRNLKSGIVAWIGGVLVVGSIVVCRVASSVIWQPSLVATIDCKAIRVGRLWIVWATLIKCLV